MSLDLAKIRGAYVKDFQTISGQKKCVVIPIEENDIWVSKKEDMAIINLILFPSKAEGKTHIVQQYINKEKYLAMTEEEKKSVPIIGTCADNPSRPGINGIKRNLKNRKKTTADVPDKKNRKPYDDIPF